MRLYALTYVRIPPYPCSSTVEDDKFYGEYAEEAFRLFLDKRRKEKSGNLLCTLG